MAKSRRQVSTADRELNAMGAIIDALEGLDGDSIQRVLDYVLGRLSIGRPSRSFSPSVAPSSVPMHGTSDSGAPLRKRSIRDLKEEKRPESANQMAALVAYYLSELAPEGEFKQSIGAQDLERYFKQAGFRLPKSIRHALPNAAAAGYFDPAGAGQYRLNPVGYNLVVHGLPPTHEGVNKRPKKAKPKKKAKR
jgi:hypothetical protein